MLEGFECVRQQNIRLFKFACCSIRILIIIIFSIEREIYFWKTLIGQLEYVIVKKAKFQYTYINMYIHLIFDVYKAFEQSRAYPASNYPQINKVDAPSSIFYTALYGVEEFSYKHFIAPPPTPPHSSCLSFGSYYMLAGCKQSKYLLFNLERRWGLPYAFNGKSI